jgi:uncharacterized damage-inducible protein DinB
MATAPALTPDFAATFRDLVLENLAREMQTTKQVIAAVPDGKADYRPDPKARTARELAWHIASVDVQFLEEITEGVFKMEPRYTEQPATIAELAEWYEKNFTRALEKARAMSAAQLTRELEFFGIMKLMAVLYLPWVSNHSIHHRGQLSSYLRPMGSKVPSIYGPSADVEMAA